MSPTRPSRRRAHRRATTTTRLFLEPLEDRCLLSALVPPANATIDQARSLGALVRPVAIAGNLGATPDQAAQVDWYSFTLAQPALVTLSAHAATGQAGPVLSLYNNDTSDSADQFDPLGHRLLAQAQGTAGAAATITQPLAAGTYFVAVSGAGNRYFNPFLADSGYPGAPASYTLNLSEAPLSLAPTAGPVVLTATPSAGGQFTRSPLVLRLDLSAGLDPSTVLQAQDVRLTFNPTGAFGGPADQDVPLSNVNYSAQANELQILPVDALAPGYYRVFLGGNTKGGQPVLLGTNKAPLGSNTAHPSGQDLTLTFQITGVEGTPGVAAPADDTFATAHPLGDVTTAGLVQAAGTIGADPAYDPNNTDPNLANPGADVDMYHFQVSGTGNYALTAEAFAGRIGSPLLPALTLFKVDPATGNYQVVGVNAGTLNGQEATNGKLPLFNDPVLFAGLTAGDYYLAVSGTGNDPDPALGAAPGVNGVFDPTVTHSGSNGFWTGDYVLNLFVQPATAPPQVVTATFTTGAQLAGPPTNFVVQFSAPVNLPQLLFLAGEQNNSTTVAQVYIKGSDGVRYFPRMVSYDAATNRASFLMLDALPNGPAEMHLSGPGGLTDLAGQPLVGSPSATGDYIVPFTVNGPARGSPGNPLLWYGGQANDTAAAPQVLGVLYPNEFQKGVVVKRTAQKGATDTADYYQFQVLQGREYVMTLSGTGLPANALPSLTAAGHPITGVPQGKGGIKYTLDPGTYVVHVGGWSSAKAATVTYTLRFGLTGAPENPPPLTIGPAPAIRVQFADSTSTGDGSGGSSGGGSGGTTTPPAGGGTTTPPTSGGTSGGTTGGTTTLPTQVNVPSGTVVPAAGNTTLANIGPGPAGPGEATPAVEVVRLSPVAVAAAPATPAGPSAKALDVSAGILLVRVTDSVGVRGEVAADAPLPSDRVLVQAQPTSALQQLARMALVGATTVQEGGDDDQPPAPELAGGPAVPETTPEQAAPAPAVTLTPVPPAVVVRGMPAHSPLDTLFAMNPLLNRLGAPSAGGAGTPTALGLGGLLASGPGSDTGADEARSHGWLNAVAWVSACAALALATWGVTNPALRRRPDEVEETASLLN
jgi:hypothetical protein